MVQHQGFVLWSILNSFQKEQEAFLVLLLHYSVDELLQKIERCQQSLKMPLNTNYLNTVTRAGHTSQEQKLCSSVSIRDWQREPRDLQAFYQKRQKEPKRSLHKGWGRGGSEGRSHNCTRMYRAQVGMVKLGNSWG